MAAKTQTEERKTYLTIPSYIDTDPSTNTAKDRSIIRLIAKYEDRVAELEKDFADACEVIRDYLTCTECGTHLIPDSNGHAYCSCESLSVSSKYYPQRRT